MNEKSRLIGGTSSDDNIFSISAIKNRILDSYKHLKVSMGTAQSDKVITAMVIFNIAIILERWIFKAIVDRLTPFSLIEVEVVLCFSVIGYFLYNIMKSLVYNLPTPNLSGFPHSRLIFLSLLDFMQLAGIFVSGYKISPGMIPLLMHANVPLSVFAAKLVFPMREYTPNQIHATMLASSAILTLVLEPIIYIFTKDSMSYIFAVVTFIAAVFLQALSNAYKEFSLVAWSQPIDVHVISGWLCLYQLIWGILLSPLLFYFQGLLNDFEFDDIQMFLSSLNDGCSCVFTGEMNDDNFKYESFEVDCYLGILLLFLFVACNFTILHCIDRIVSLNPSALGVSVNISLFLSFVVMTMFYASDLGLLLIELPAFFMLIIALDIYYKEPEADVELLTSYSPILSQSTEFD